MRTLIAAILFATACTTADSVTDLGEFSPETKADVQSIKVPLKLAAGESSEFALTVDGPFQAKAVYSGTANVTIASDTLTASGVQPVLVVDAGRTPTDYLLKVTNTSATPVSGTFEIGPAPASCSDAVWIGWFDTLVSKIDAAGSIIDSTERSNINVVVSSRPCESTSDGAFSRWHQVFDAKLTGFGSIIDTDEKAVLDLIVPQRPDAIGEGAYLTWLPKFATAVSNAGSIIDTDERRQIDLRLSVRPKSTTSAGYVSWAEKLRPMLSGAGSIIDTDEKALMMTFISGKPCAQLTTEAQAAWNALAAAGTGDGAAPILDAAKPTAGCQ